MSIHRIAVELFAHAVGYFVGGALKKINKKWADYLIKKGKLIEVNNNDNRVTYFYAVWASASVIRQVGITMGNPYAFLI